MKIEAIPNKGPASMGPEVTECFNWASSSYIASAFLTSASLERIEEALIEAEKTHNPTEIRLLIGLYQRFTSATSIAKAYKLQEKYPNKFGVRISRNNRFHWKLYMFTKNSDQRIYVGSANFTEDGLTASGELSVKITAQTTDQISKSLQHEFNSLWEDRNHSFSPNEKFLSDYKKLNNPSRQFKTSPDNPITKLLHNAQRIPRKKRPLLKDGIKPRLIFADSYLSDETINKIKKEKNNWDNWNYVCLNKRNFELTRKAGVVVYVTNSANDKRQTHDNYSISINRIEDSVELETADGKYFVAFSKIPYSSELKYGDIKAELSKGKLGLIWKKLSSDRFLNKIQIELLCKLFGIKWSTILKRLA